MNRGGKEDGMRSGMAENRERAGTPHNNYLRIKRTESRCANCIGPYADSFSIEINGNRNC